MNIYVTVDLEKKWHRFYDSFYCLISADQMCFPSRKHMAEELVFFHVVSWILNNWTDFYHLSPISLLSQVLRVLTWMYNKKCTNSIQNNKYLFSIHCAWDTMPNRDAINSQSVIIQTQPRLYVTIIPFMKKSQLSKSARYILYIRLCSWKLIWKSDFKCTSRACCSNNFIIMFLENI